MTDALLSLWKGDVQPPHPPEPPLGEKVRAILRQAAAFHGVTVDDIKGSRRFLSHCMARQEAMWRLREIKAPDGSPRLSLPRIGQIVGGVDHTTVLHGVRAHERRRRL